MAIKNAKLELAKKIAAKVKLKAKKPILKKSVTKKVADFSGRQNDPYREELDEQKTAKYAGYRWTDKGAEKAGKKATNRPTKAEVAEWGDKTFKLRGDDTLHNYIYKETREDHADLNKKAKLADGGDIAKRVIENQYEDLEAKELWDEVWTKEQKEHFLKDHEARIAEIEESYFEEGEILELARYKFNGLPADVKKALKQHIKEGQYADGGMTANDNDKYTYNIVKIKMYRLGKDGKKIYFDGLGAKILLNGQIISSIPYGQYDTKEEIEDRCKRAIQEMKAGNYKGMRFADGGTLGAGSFAEGGDVKRNLSRDRKFVNKAEKYEVEYYREHPNRRGKKNRRTGYMGNLDFPYYADGGTTGAGSFAEGGKLENMSYSELNEYIQDTYASHIKSTSFDFVISETGDGIDMIGKSMKDQHQEIFEENADYTEANFTENSGGYTMEGFDTILSPEGEVLTEVQGGNTYNQSYLGGADFNYKIYEDKNADKYFLISLIHVGGDIRGNYGSAYIFDGDSEEEVISKFYGLISGFAHITIEFDDNTSATFDSQQDSDVWHFEVYDEITDKKGLAKKFVEDFESYESWHGDDFLIKTIEEANEGKRVHGYAKGGEVKRNLSRDRKFVNKAEKYEVEYYREHPNRRGKKNRRTGYMGNLDFPYYAHGGDITKRVIENNYDGLEAKELWDEVWTSVQKEHFLKDHKARIEEIEETYYDSIYSLGRYKYSALPADVKKALKQHISEGQYERGGDVYAGGGFFQAFSSFRPKVEEVRSGFSGRQNNPYREELDIERFAKKTGYRWTDIGAKKAGKNPKKAPSLNDIKEWGRKTFKLRGDDTVHQYIYKETREDHSDLNPSVMFQSLSDGGTTGAGSFARGGTTKKKWANSSQYIPKYDIESITLKSGKVIKNISIYDGAYISKRVKLEDGGTTGAGSFANGGQVDMDKHIWEGWTVGDFIEELEPSFNQIMSGGSWQKPFSSKDELKKWCMDNQPYYKKHIPEVVNYFWAKTESKMADGGTTGAGSFARGGGVSKIANVEAASHTENLIPFTANNLEGKLLPNGDYVVLSYGFYPIWWFCKAENKWYGNATKYSVTTSKHSTQSRPTFNATMVSRVELDELMMKHNARFEDGFEDGGKVQDVLVQAPAPMQGTAPLQPVVTTTNPNVTAATPTAGATC